MFIAADVWAYVVLENTGFKHVVRVLEPIYNVPSRVHFSQSVVLPCINERKLQFIFVIYFFLLTIWQHLSALTLTIRILAIQPLLNVQNISNHDPKTKVHTELWLLCAVTPLHVNVNCKCGQADIIHRREHDTNSLLLKNWIYSCTTKPGSC